MHTDVGTDVRTVAYALMLLLLLSTAAVVSAATFILDFQCPETVENVSPGDNGGELTLSAGKSNKTYVLAAGTYNITSWELTLTKNNTCYIAAEGAHVTVTARLNDGYAWVLRQGATLGLQGLTLKGEGQISVPGPGAGGVFMDFATRLVASNVNFVGLGRPSSVQLPGGVWNNGRHY